jgi:hypothetical protein
VLTSVYIDHTAEVSISDLQSANETHGSFARYRFTEFTAWPLHITVWARLYLLKHACVFWGITSFRCIYSSNYYYHYVPAGALTLKCFVINSPCFNTTLLKITSNLHPKLFKKHLLKRMVKIHNRLLSILLHVSDVEHPSSGSMAAHGWSWD